MSAMNSRAVHRWSICPADSPVAVGGSVTPTALLAAYQEGLFPFPADDSDTVLANALLYGADVADGRVAVLDGPEEANPYAITWWHPDPRLLIPQGGIHLVRSLRRTLRRSQWTTTCNTAFSHVVRACAKGRTPAWLTEDYRRALDELHKAGWAHSVEVWERGELVGGVFGLAFGATFSADSAFRRRSGAAQAALAELDARLAGTGVAHIDVQWDSPYLRDLGARPVPRDAFLKLLTCEPTPIRIDGGPREVARLGAPSVTAGSVPEPPTIPTFPRKDSHV
ncbi:leucyl/phenylalanyl-tRNA--protein transferase [Streptomyces tibetensis]|uniref:leucyl/phenylalanyl-tRNA--protein transferase n=1 Tax=Streptomyces tibetensis TaxID=2382123 RepID=UPI0033E1EE15